MSIHKKCFRGINDCGFSEVVHQVITVADMKAEKEQIHQNTIINHTVKK